MRALAELPFATIVGFVLTGAVIAVLLGIVFLISSTRDKDPDLQVIWKGLLGAGIPAVLVCLLLLAQCSSDA